MLLRLLLQMLLQPVLLRPMGRRRVVLVTLVKSYAPASAIPAGAELYRG
jgi:hypothetical protein